MKPDRNALFQLFLEQTVFYSGKILSLNDKKKSWNEFELPSGTVVFIDDTDPLSLSVKILKAWSQGKKVILTHNLNKSFLNHWKAEYEQADFDYGVWTSGSTGAPKLNLFSLDQGFLNSRMHWNGYRDTDSVETIIQSLPLYHSFGLVCILLTSLQFNKKLALFKQTPSLNLLSQMSLKKCLLNWTPSHLRLYARMNKEDVSFLSVISIGSSHLSDSDRVTMKERFSQQTCYLTYGMTELGPRISTQEFNIHTSVLNNLGTPLNSVQWKVVDENNNKISNGMGWLSVKSPTLAKNLLAKVDAEGFFQTKDQVQTQSDQSVYFIARDSAVVKKSGVRIHLPFIENIIRRFADVYDCYLSKDEHPIFGEVPILYFVGDLSEEDMWGRLKRELAADFQPHKVYKLNQLPRNEFHKMIEDELLKIRLGLEKSDKAQ